MRFEFTRKQRAEMFARAGGRCECCGAKLKVGEGEYDHVIAQGYGGSNDIGNGQVLCRVCHKAKTKLDVGIIAKSNRVRDKHAGFMPPQAEAPRPQL